MDSHASLRHSGHDKTPVLFNGAAAGCPPDIIVKIDGDADHLSTHPISTTTTTTTTITNNNNSSNKVWREASYDFWKDGAGTNGGSCSEFSFASQNQDKERHGVEVGDDPPSTLLPGGKRSNLDAGFGANEPKKPPFSNVDSASRELRPSFQDRSSSASDEDGRHGGAEVLQCTSNASFRWRSSTLLRAKTRSRLMDPTPPPPPADDGEKRDRPTNPSEQLRSGFVGRPADDDNEDPFFDEDAPAGENFKRGRFQWRIILEWASLVLIVATLACSLSVAVLRRKGFWGLRLWKWELLALVLISGRLVSGWVIRVAVFFLERSFLLRKRVLYFVYGVRKAVQNCLWLGLVLLAWRLLFDKEVERETKTEALTVVSKVLLCFLVATLIWLAKTVLVKALASSFHVSTYFERIQENLFNQYAIQILSGPPLIGIQHAREEEDRFFTEVTELQNAGAAVPTELRAATMRNGKSVKCSKTTSKKEATGRKNEGITMDHLHKLNQKNVSAWNMKRLMKMVMHGRLMLLHDEMPNAGAEDESMTEIQSEFEAKAAAKKMFSNVAKPGAQYIYLVDLMRFMKEDEALKTMNLIEGDQESDRLSKKSLKNWVIHAFRERRALSFTLNDTKTAVNKLHLMANIVVIVIVGCIWILILGFAPTHFFVFISSQLLLVTFVFGNTLKTVFEAIIFLFVTHPFDVGDRCEVEGVQMVVEEMNILTTIFLRYDNQKIIYPNSVLATIPIGNIYRSPDMGDSIDFCIHVATPVEKLAVMKERIKEFIERKKDHWYPNPTVMLKDIDDMNRLKLANDWRSESKIIDSKENQIQSRYFAESRAICRFICDKFPAQGNKSSMGSGLLGRALVDQWAGSALVFQLVFAPSRKLKTDPAAISESETKLKKVLDVYDRRLGECRFLAGDEFSLADLSHLPNAHYLVTATDRGHLLTSRKNVGRWWEEISARPSWKMRKAPPA
ncbi:Mechanosensitive ion channel protein 6 [Cocos nucifera]|uniref:glutathione transferase n=1 Tax=Cocos nucifera TaxID=13894 RepID=A0A8K0N6Q2_COCNU|nr:Mechanosensitive ion channel protein 6 [Cocos nucifera]